jgi:alginate O-acetyltransferase complex protein AlgI
VDFLPQLERRAKARLEGIEAGAAQFLIGAIKKAVLADQIAGNVNQIFSGASQFDSFTLLEGMLGFAAQLYCDFSGYSDMAIGCARVLGFEFAENFQMPFSSVSITEFWRRWHITMSSWFRDYLFLPLEIATRSNPMPLLRMSLNITLTMLLCGLWHGPSWNYVIYGGVHGVALAGHKVWTSCKPAPAWVKGRAVEFLANLAARGLTLGVVVLSLVFFRTATVADAMTYLSRMFSAGHQGERMFSMYIYPVVGVVFLAHLLINKDRNLALELPRMSVGVRVAAYAFLLTVLVSLGATEGAPFVYFKF